MLRNVRLILAVILTLTAAALLYYKTADHVPHDPKARVSATDFWTAIARSDLSRRPSDIIVYPTQLGVQLITCTAHLPDGKTANKYVYVSTPDGSPTAESRLATASVPYRVPLQHTRLMRGGPWIAFTLSACLLAWPYVIGLTRLLSDASKPSPDDGAVAPTTPAVTPADLQKLHQLDEELERSLVDSAAPATARSPSADPTAPAAPVVLNGGPLDQIEQAPQKPKDYAGEFYPVAKPKESGFSLVELLVVIGLIGILIALLLPTLAGARRDANQIFCAANLRSVSQGLAIYENEYQGCVPASYSYFGQSIVNGQQTYTAEGYTHWSYFLYHEGSTPAGAFQCPELEGGGLPPMNTPPDNRLPGQVPNREGVVDQQVPRCAYTLNEALSPRNKFELDFQDSTRVYQFVKASSVPNSSGTILATEWSATAARYADRTVTPGAYRLYSHRPVHGFVGTDGTLEMYQLNQSTPYRRVTAADIDPDPATASSSTTRLDWVGRNHGRVNSYPDQRRTNFLYLDGHVECKRVYDTLQPFEWGETFFSLVPNGDLQHP